MLHAFTTYSGRARLAEREVLIVNAQDPDHQEETDSETETKPIYSLFSSHLGLEVAEKFFSAYITGKSPSSICLSELDFIIQIVENLFCLEFSFVEEFFSTTKGAYRGPIKFQCFELTPKHKKILLREILFGNTRVLVTD